MMEDLRHAAENPINNSRGSSLMRRGFNLQVIYLQNFFFPETLTIKVVTYYRRASAEETMLRAGSYKGRKAEVEEGAGVAEKQRNCHGLIL